MKIGERTLSEEKLGDRSCGVGIVGAGFGRHAHLPAFRRSPYCQVIALLGSTPELTADIARTENLPAVFSSWEELVVCEAIDIVAVALPPSEQSIVARAALQAGKHLFCEKPLGVSLLDAESIVSALGDRPLVHGVDLLFRGAPLWREIKSLLEETAGVTELSFSWHTSTRAVELGKHPWKLDAPRGGGALLNFGPHVIHLVEWLLGPLQNVECVLAPSIEKNTHFAVRGTTAAGVAVGINVTTDDKSGNGISCTILDSLGRIEVHSPKDRFTRGIITRIDESSLKEQLYEDLSASGEDRLECVATLVHGFVEAIIAETSFTPNLHDGVRVQKVLDSLCLAAARGRAVECL